jgi:hypothetical protein
MPDIRYVTVCHIDENFYLDTRYVYLVDRFKSFINEPKKCNFSRSNIISVFVLYQNVNMYIIKKSVFFNQNEKLHS